MNTLPLSHPAWVEIDLNQFKKNIQLVQQHIGKSKFCLPIKANAYGHGIIPIAKAAVEAKVDYLGVSCLQEGAILRKAGIKIPIFVMGAIHEEQIEELLNHQLEFTVSSLYKAKLVAEKCLRLQKKGKVHIEMDTGMQRTGVRPQTAIELLNFLQQAKCFELTGVYTHFATADKADDEFAKIQIETFKTFVDSYIRNPNNPYPNTLCHISNSGGVCHFPEAHMDMVRPGLLVFGCFEKQFNNPLESIQSIFNVKAKISYFKVVDANQGISYNHSYKTKDKTRIVTIPVGYGDGFRRALSNRGSVIIRGKRYPIVGTVCMDQFMVDIGQNEAYVGDEVILVGKQGLEEITLQEMATLCDTIPYEILCGFNDRLPRFYY